MVYGRHGSPQEHSELDHSFFRHMLWYIYRNILDITIVYNSVILYSQLDTRPENYNHTISNEIPYEFENPQFFIFSSQRRPEGVGPWQPRGRQAGQRCGGPRVLRPATQPWPPKWSENGEICRVQDQTYLVGGLEHVFSHILGYYWRTPWFFRGVAQPPTRYGWKMLNPQKPLNWCDFSNENCALTSTIWGWCAWRLNYVEASGTGNQPSARSGQQTLRLVIKKK